ncbi:MAG: hypothetical protein RL677_555, partial [Actinomycetota bacterium]
MAENNSPKDLAPQKRIVILSRGERLRRISAV